jgi:hypothetical protein
MDYLFELPPQGYDTTMAANECQGMLRVHILDKW